MDKPQRIVIVAYCAAIACAALYVPWVVQKQYANGVLANIDFGYAFILSSPLPGMATINYGVIFLEIAAITAVAVVAYIFRDKLYKLIK